MARIINSNRLVCLCLMAALFKPGGSQFTTTGCGTTKGCFMNPSTCTGSTDCEFFVSWEYNADNNQVNFKISGQATTYVALGLSKSGRMDNSDVYACTKSSSTILRSQNTEYSNAPQTLKGISNVAVIVNNGRIECEFTREAFLDDNDATYFDISGSNKYTVIMAKSNNGDGSLVYHGAANRVFDSAPVSFTQFTSPAMPTQPPGGGVMTTKQNINTDSGLTASGCGTIKSCFRDPQDCTGASDCNFFVSWTADLLNNNNKFKMTGTNAGSYVVLGFSKSGKMADSDVYACTKNNEVVRSRNTNGNINDPSPPLKGVTNVTIQVINGRIECDFTRQVSLNDNDETYYDLSGNNTYTIIMSKSSGDLQAGNIQFHQGGRVASASKISFQDISEVGGVMDDLAMLLRKLHGCLMVAAWVGFASVGITLARFYKNMGPQTTICGKPIWFTFHRLFMVLTFLCTVAAFVIIFVQKKEFIAFSTEMPGVQHFAHAVLGTIVTFLVIVNPIMALLRPHPGEPRRAIFNWAHWAVGTTAHLAGMATIGLGLCGFNNAMPLIGGLPKAVFWVMVVFIAFHVILWTLLQVHQWMTNCLGGSSRTPLVDRKGSVLGSTAINILLLVYVIGVFIAAAFIIISIAIVGLHDKVF